MANLSSIIVALAILLTGCSAPILYIDPPFSSLKCTATCIDVGRALTASHCLGEDGSGLELFEFATEHCETRVAFRRTYPGHVVALRTRIDTRPAVVMSANDDWLVLSGRAREGDSGGAVYTQAGGLVGVIVGGGELETSIARPMLGYWVSDEYTREHGSKESARQTSEGGT